MLTISYSWYCSPKRMPSTSPGRTAVPGLPSLPLTVMCPVEHASLATLRRLMMREIFRNLSSRMELISTRSTGFLASIAFLLIFPP